MSASGDDDRYQVEALKQSLAKLKHKLDDQAERIEALAREREESTGMVGELRAELALVAAERDRLRKRLTELEGMQTETLVLDDSAIGDNTDRRQHKLPSIDELMSAFSGDGASPRQSHSTMHVESSSSDTTGDYQEMISPEVMVKSSGWRDTKDSRERFLVLLEPDSQTKCPMDQDLITIGRSESADINIEGDSISRIHARVLPIGKDMVIEDAGSRNGTWVNGERVQRCVLRHGDLIRVGSGNLRYVDTGAAESDPD